MNWLIFWIAVTIISFIVEIATVGLVSIWFTFAGIGSIVVNLLGGSILLQWLVFVIVSIIGLLLFKHYWFKKMKPNLVPMNLDRFINKKVFVFEKIDNSSDTGAVKIDGQLWTARTIERTIINIGEEVIIKSREGNTLFVEKIKEV